MIRSRGVDGSDAEIVISQIIQSIGGGIASTATQVLHTARSFRIGGPQVPSSIYVSGCRSGIRTTFGGCYGHSDRPAVDGNWRSCWKCHRLVRLDVFGVEAHSIRGSRRHLAEPDAW